MQRHVLEDALNDLHGDLLAGFEQWRDKFSRNKSLPDVSTPKLAGAWSLGGPAGSKFKSLPEVATYLLVWGEAGNLRFMPELICFLTELALAAAPPHEGDLYAGCPSVGSSRPFLVHIVRPIYNVIFDENHTQVKINDKNMRDVKELRATHQKYMPADCINYDDWNELFSNPNLLAKALVLKNGSKLWDIE